MKSHDCHLLKAVVLYLLLAMVVDIVQCEKPTVSESSTNPSSTIKKSSSSTSPVNLLDKITSSSSSSLSRTPRKSPNTSNKNYEMSTTPSLGPPGSPQLKPRVLTLNVMVAGLSGLGKTTMCQSLMECWKQGTINNNDNEKSRSSPKRRSKFDNELTRMEIPKTTTHIDASRIFERYDEATNTILRVRIIDTPGFGNRINYWNSVKPITRYINQCRNSKYQSEMSPVTSVQDYVNYCNDNHTDESLVHVCLYLISPGRFLEIDKHFLKHVRKEITVVPIIAKADTLTDEEIARYRAELTSIFKKEKLKAYDFDQSPTRFAFYRGRRSGELLAIISRNGHYPWGNSSALNPDHSDLQLIRDLLLSEHTERFLELALVKYATYRSNRLAKRKMQDTLKYLVLGGLLMSQVSTHIPVGQTILASLSAHMPSSRGLATIKSKKELIIEDESLGGNNEVIDIEEEVELQKKEEKGRKMPFGLFGIFDNKAG